MRGNTVVRSILMRLGVLGIDTFPLWRVLPRLKSVAIRPTTSVLDAHEKRINWKNYARWECSVDRDSRLCVGMGFSPGT